MRYAMMAKTRCAMAFGMLLAWAGIAAAASVSLDPFTYDIRPLVENPQWSLTGAPTPVKTASGVRLAAPKAGVSAAWLTTEAPGRMLLSFRWIAATPHTPRLDLFFQAEGIQRGIAAKGYVLTMERLANDDKPALRLRLSKRPMPPFRFEYMMEAFVALGDAASPKVEVAVAAVDDDIAVYADGVPVIFWTDHGLATDRSYYTKGRAGFVVEAGPTGTVEVENVRLDTVVTCQAASLPALKPLRLESDLTRARIVAGSNPLHRELAAQVASALEPKLNRRLEVVTPEAALADLTARPVEGVAAPLILLGNLADNAVVRKLYCEWFCMVDKVFPGKGGFIVQTIHNPYGNGRNLVLLGASDDDGLKRAAARFIELVPAGGALGRLYDVQPAEGFARLRDYDSAKEPYLTLPLTWPHHYGLRSESQQAAVVYLVTGDDRWAQRYREAVLKEFSGRIIDHLYVPVLGLVWDLMEEHPVFSDAERLSISNFLLKQLRSRECIGALHIQNTYDGMPHQNHGTRPALGSYFLARYFRDQYGLAEARVYLDVLRRYFDMQADWSKPMCDSTMHQYIATLEDKAIYALASGEMRFFESGAAREAAERALRSTNPLGVLPIYGDTQYGVGADSLLAKAAFYYDDPRYLWPLKLRGDRRSDSDELARAFAVHAAPAPPLHTVGVSVIPWDKGFWAGWRCLPPPRTYPEPNVPFDRAFDKIAFRTGVERNDEFLLLDGMLSASHDYDDVNTIHEYSRNGRIYLTSADHFLASTMPHHNGVNIVRDGLSSTLPSAAEVLHAGRMGPFMVSRTRLNDFGGSDWTRNIVLAPGAWFVVIDRMTAREAGAFSFTGHWRALGTPAFRDDTLTVRQEVIGAPRGQEQYSYFHVQADGDSVRHTTMPYRYSINVRFYPYARAALQVVEQSRIAHLEKGGSSALCTLAQETGSNAAPAFRMASVASGVVRVSDGRQGTYVGAPGEAFRCGLVEIEADLFCLDARTLCVVGGRRAVIDGRSVLKDNGEAVQTIPLEGSDRLARQLLSEEFDLRRTEAAGAAELPPLKTIWRVQTGGEVRTLRVERMPPNLGIIAAPVRLGPKADKGRVIFLNAEGAPVKTLEADSGVNDVAVSDLDGDGIPEMLLAREDRTLQCLDAAGAERFSFAPKQESIVNSMLWLGTNSMQRVWVADLQGKKTIVVSSGDQRVHGLNPQGERQWLFWSYAGIFTTFGLCDADDDGLPEIAGGNGAIASSDEIWFLKGTDTFFRRLFNDGWGAALSAMAVGDLDGDGKDEIVVGTTRATLRAWNPRASELLWMHHLGDSVKSVLIVRETGRPPRVMAGALSGFVTAFDGAGVKQWATPVGGPVAFLLRGAVQGKPILYAVCENGVVVALDLNGVVTHRLIIPAAPTAAAVSEAQPQLLVVAADSGEVLALAP